MKNVKKTQARRVRSIALVVVLALALAFGVQQAFAYTLTYYMGSPSSPIYTNGSIGGVTCCTSYRLFNEATAVHGTGLNDMSWVHLSYTTGDLGTSSNTWYFIVYGNGPGAKAVCNLTHGTGGTTAAYCDTNT